VGLEEEEDAMEEDLVGWLINQSFGVCLLVWTDSPVETLISFKGKCGSAVQLPHGGLEDFNGASWIAPTRQVIKFFHHLNQNK
jgi:hypothetical protein